MSNVSDNVTVIIPTKNRPEDLKQAVESILSQCYLPNQLVIVDQSTDQGSQEKISSLPVPNETELTYIYDPSILGLVDAKRVGVENSHNEIICFLEDDVVLNDTYISEIMIGFRNNTSMIGCAGVISNQPNVSSMYVFFHDLFFRGIYFDPRIKICMNKSSQIMIQCDVLSGGLSCWRSSVFDAVKFDIKNNFFMLEDIEFSTRVSRQYEKKLFINKRAQLNHKWSPINRDAHGFRQKRKLKESIIFYKKRKTWNGAISGQLLAMCWWFMESMFQSIRLGSLKPLSGFFSGVREGLNQELFTETN